MIFLMPLKKRIIIYLLTLASLLLLLAWISDEYPGFLNENYNGSLARLDSYNCVENTNQICGQDFSGRIENLLVGDSEALSISDLFVKKSPENSRSLALSGCSFLPGGIVRLNITEQCKDWNMKILNFLNEDCHKDVYLFNRFKPETYLESELYLDFLLQTGKKCKRFTIIGTPAELIGNFSAYSSLFIDSPINTPKYFDESDFDSFSIAWSNRMKQWERRHQNLVNYIDTNELILGKFPTKLMNSKKQLLYGDSTHLSKYGGEILVNKIFDN
jgi:hypothetical protein